MLIRFKVTNYLSFDTTQEFTTYQGKTKLKPEHILKSGKRQFLKFSALYGANASGKSNFVDAIAFSKYIILHELPAGIANNYFKINPQNKTKPTTFEYEIELNDKYYAYGIDLILNENKIIGEWLYEITPGNKDKLIFQRQPAKPETEKPFELSKKYTNKDISAYLRGMKTNTQKLFLNDINDGKNDLFENNPKLKPIQDVYRWFAEKLIVTPPGVLQTPPDKRNPFRPFYLREDIDETLINQIIPSLGLGITNVQINNENPKNINKYLPPEKITALIQIISQHIKDLETQNNKKPASITFSIQENKESLILKIDPVTLTIQSIKRMQFHHDGNTNTLFDYGEESDGTRIMLNHVDLLFAALGGTDNVYIIDEIDLGLHPLLTYRLIELFLKLSKGKMQLIVTTHESHLMNLNLLRRDEIWLITKHSDGASELKSLDEYSVRFDKRLTKAYLSGLYGGIPIIDTYLPIEHNPKTPKKEKNTTEKQ